MKLAAIIASGIAAAVMAVPAANAEQRVVHRERVVTTHRTTVVRHGGPRYHALRRVCTVRYHHHRRIRTCRTVRA